MEDIKTVEEPKLDWDKIPHRVGVRPFLEAVEAKRKEIFTSYMDLRKKEASQEATQEAINLAFELAKLNAKARALSFLTFNPKPLTIRKYPQYHFQCKLCGENSAYRVKELAEATKMAHIEMSKRGPITLCTMAKTEKGVLKPHAQGFKKTIEEFQEIEKILLEAK